MWEEKGGAEIIKFNNLKNKGSSLTVCVSIFVIVCILLILSGSYLIKQLNENDNYFYKAMKLINVLTDSGKNILNQGLPLLNSNLASPKVIPNNPEDMVKYFLYSLTRVDVADSKTLLSACISIMNIKKVNHINSTESLGLTDLETQYYQKPIEKIVKREQEVSQEEQKKISLFSKPLVAVYTTHNAETFIPTDGTAKIEGKNAGVAKVAKTLSETLEKKHSIKTVYTDTI
ncbi:MAG: stage II sporulation protein P, partial [Opitutales bacterium]|nr:stage II sporulation protein P [Opitutales bacterium]